MAAQILRGSPAGLGVDTSRSFNNQSLTGVKTITNADATTPLLVSNAAAGVQIGAAAGTLVGLHGAAPVAQNGPATVAAPRVAAGAGLAVLDDTTYGVVPNVYTIGQIVAALRQHGILA